LYIDAAGEQSEERIFGLRERERNRGMKRTLWKGAL
jgi:hypothetical protein